jgi:hypothetical protein
VKERDKMVRISKMEVIYFRRLRKREKKKANLRNLFFWVEEVEMLYSKSPFSRSETLFCFKSL